MSSFGYARYRGVFRFPCSLLSYMVHPMLNGQTEQYWPVVSDRSVKIFVALFNAQNISSVKILIDPVMGLYARLAC